MARDSHSDDDAFRDLIDTGLPEGESKPSEDRWDRFSVVEADEQPGEGPTLLVRCPECGETMPLTSDEIAHGFHVVHLSEEERRYAERMDAEHEQRWEALEAKEQAQERARTLAGDAAGRHGMPPDLPRESAMAGLGERDDQDEDTESDR